MSDYRKASPEVISAIRAAADSVAQVFTQLGVRAFHVDDRGAESGVEIETDIGDHFGQGVYLSWFPGAEVVDAAVEAMRSGRLDDPNIELQGHIRTTQLSVIRKTLRESGVEYEEIDDDYRPFAIRVPFRQFSS